MEEDALFLEGVVLRVPWGLSREEMRGSLLSKDVIERSTVALKDYVA
jgi:hypothetical protein